MERREAAPVDLKKCRILLDAIDCRNLSKVAKDYGYTPSGVWHMIDAIENELGFPLFLRGSGGVTPTDNCLRIAPELRELVKCSGRFSRKLEEIRGIESGSVTVGSYPSVSIQWLPHVIKALEATRASQSSGCRTSSKPSAPTTPA